MKQKTQSLKICISGAPTATGSCGIDALEIGRALGREIASQDMVLTTTATTGFPMWAALGAQGVGGLTVAFSPAASESDHVQVHKLPTEGFDMMVYTGFGASGASVLALRSSDAIIFGCGGMTSLLEVTTAVQEQRPIGILKGSWDLDEVIRNFLTENYPDYVHVVSDDDPVRLLEQLTKHVKVKNYN